MSANDKPSTHEFRQMLARGEIPLDDWTLHIEVNRSTILDALAHHLKGTPREWKVENHSWNRDELLVDILWYPKQPVFLTFQNGVLSLVEFSGSGESESKWDYSLEVRKYFQMKTDAVKQLGEENRSNESNDQNMEVIWEFANLVFYIACDARTGGCGVGLRAN